MRIKDHTKYFEIIDETLDSKRWHLEEPRVLGQSESWDFWPLISGADVDERSFRNLNAPIQQEGQSLSFTLGAFLIPYVNKEIGKVILSVTERDCALLPCLIGGTDLSYSVLVVNKKLKCLDDQRSIVEYYREGDFFEGEPKRVGQIKSLVTAKIHRNKVPHGVHLFRLEEDLTRLIASERLVAALKAANVSGISFQEI